MGHFKPFLGTHKIRTFSQALFPLQWLFVSSFHAQTYIIYKKWHFLAKFSPQGGHFGYPDYSKYVFSNVFLYYVCRKDFWRNNYLFHGIIVEKWPFLWNFELFWAILGYFGPIWAISRYPEFLNCCPMHYLPSNDFLSAAFRHKHCFSCVFDSQTMNFGLKWGFFLRHILLSWKITPKTLETCL